MIMAFLMIMAKNITYIYLDRVALMNIRAIGGDEQRSLLFIT